MNENRLPSGSPFSFVCLCLAGQLLVGFAAHLGVLFLLYKPDECFDYMNRLPEKFEQMSFLDP